MDTLSPEARSALMRSVRQRNTTPEQRVRSIAHRLGYRFRLHRRDLPGTPDLVFPALRTCLFVHGCFWHRHPGCKLTTTPKTRVDFWEAKFEANVERDHRKVANLEGQGWRVAVIWECETRDPDKIAKRLHRLLDGETTQGQKVPTGLHERT